MNYTHGRDGQTVGETLDGESMGTRGKEQRNGKHDVEIRENRARLL